MSSKKIKNTSRNDLKKKYYKWRSNLCWKCFSISLILICFSFPSFVNWARSPEEIAVDQQDLINFELFRRQEGPLIATIESPVRFPSKLKEIRPENWPKKYWKYLTLRFFPWANSSECEQLYVSFAPPGSRHPVALASYPGSGNTWLRYLLESGSGIFTGSPYTDHSLALKGMYGEKVMYNSGMTIATKIHQRLSNRFMKEVTISHRHRAVVLIRNPFEAVMSLFNYYGHPDKHVGLAPESALNSKSWHNFAQIQALEWKNFNVEWINTPKLKDLHIVFYEELKTQPLEITKAILRFLNISTEGHRMDCISRHLQWKFRRPERKLDFNPFTVELKEIIYEAIDEVNEVLLTKINKTLPIDEYKYYLVSESIEARKRISRKRL